MYSMKVYLCTICLW